jgi:hypothetical protein
VYIYDPNQLSIMRLLYILSTLFLSILLKGVAAQNVPDHTAGVVSTAQTILKDLSLPSFRLDDVQKIVERTYQNASSFEGLLVTQPERYFTKWKNNQEGLANSLRPFCDRRGLQALDEKIRVQRIALAKVDDTYRGTNTPVEEVIRQKIKISLF